MNLIEKNKGSFITIVISFSLFIITLLLKIKPLYLFKVGLNYPYLIYLNLPLTFFLISLIAGIVFSWRAYNE